MSVATAVGRALKLDHKGEGYTLAPVDHVRVVADFEDHLRRKALGEVDRVRSTLGPVGGDAAMRAYLDNSTAGVYDFGSPFWNECARHAEHQKAILLASLRVHQPRITRALAAEIYAAGDPAVAELIYGRPDEAADADAGDGPGADPGNPPAGPGSPS